MTAYVFVDANCILHFRRVDQIDWQALTGVQEVVLVAAPIVLREIEQQRVRSHSRKVRERAAQFSKWLETYIDNPGREVRPGVKWLLVGVEPTIEFGAHNLARDIADDHLIASVLSFQLNEPDKVLVATADVGVRVKLSQRKIMIVRLPDAERLPDEPDPQEKELQELRRQMALRREPNLTIVGPNGSTRCELIIGPEPKESSVPTIELVRMENPRLELPDPSNLPESGKSLVELMKFNPVVLQCSWMNNEQIEEYNTKRERFFEEYKRYCEDQLAWEQAMALTCEVQLSLANVGTAPANDIDVELAFPDFVKLATEADLPNRPARPAAPRRPSIVPTIRMPEFRETLGLRHAQFHAAGVELEGLPEISENGQDVSFWFRNVKQGTTANIRSFYCRFPSRGSLQSFSARCIISAAEMRQAMEQEFHFIVAPEVNAQK